MKLHILYNKKHEINNYVNLLVEENGVDLRDVIANSCDEIIISEALDYIQYKYINYVLEDIVHRLRLGGKIIITGIDIKALSRLVVSELVSIEQYNDIIMNIKSLNTILNIRALLVSYNLDIELDLINGYKYQIIAKRKNA